ncbi:MAG: ATP-dependent Clp protease ATP-binding subunit ClpX, partial [Holosporaceae bacterium]|nr:ATP-dependent Clp protease ATP-binding subunit ClpX [Holosporaceae bacterium]
MGRMTDGDRTLRCSFCGKTQHEVKKLIVGPTVYICNECIELCAGIISEVPSNIAQKEKSELPSPQEICKTLDDYIIGQDKAK